MNNARSLKLIDDLALTRSEERALRYLAGLPNPEPRSRIGRCLGRLLERPLKGLEGLGLALMALVVLAALLYLFWRLVIVLHLVDYLEGIALALLAFYALFDLWVRGRLIRKLYRALESERTRQTELQQGTEQAAAELP